MIVALLTDFGLEDGFVAVCHGVMIRLAPQLRILDVTHLVPPGDVRRGAALLAQVVPYLPAAVVVGVVDPGVGTERRAVAVETGDHVLVGPDNGLLGWAAEVAGGAVRAHEISPGGKPVSATFHGRDVFAPAAAQVATGTPIDRLGPPVALDSLIQLRPPVSRVGAGRVEGEVLTVDRYGNLQTCLRPEQAAAAGLRVGTEVTVGVTETTPKSPRTELPEPPELGPAAPARYGRTFGSVPAGELVVFVDSAGLVAVAVNGGSAARRLAAGAGTLLQIAHRSDPG